MFTGLGPRWLCPLSKTEDIDVKGKRFAVIEEIKEKSRSVSRIGKSAGISEGIMSYI